MGFCMNCGRELPPEAGFCPKCGTKVEVPICPKCGKIVDLDDDFCPFCGARINSEPESGPESQPQPEPIPEPEPVLEPASEPGSTSEPQPQPEPTPKKTIEPPEVCPRCGKPSVSGYEHCVYCGTYWDPEEKPKPVKSVPSAVPTQPALAPERQGSAVSEGSAWRDFSWAYRRAMMRWSMHMDIHAELDEKRLRCTSTSKILGQTDVVEEEMPLEGISKITLASKASFVIWTAVSWMLSTFVALLSLPLFGVSLAIGGTELMLTALFLAGLCALTVWWVRFNLFHHRLVITGTVDGAEKKIVLEALKSDPLKELQEELTHRTGIQLPQQNESTGEFKSAFGAIIGICLAIALVVAVTKEMPSTAEGQTSGNAGLVSTQKATASPQVRVTINGQPPLEEQILGCWESQYIQYYDTGEVLNISGTSHMWFYDDHTYEFIEGSDYYHAGDWTVVGDTISLTDYYDDDERTIIVRGDQYSLGKPDKSVGYKKLSDDPDYIPAGVDMPSDDTYYLRELVGYWEDTVYTMPSTAFMSIEEDGNGNISVYYGFPNGGQYEGTLRVDTEGDAYADMTYAYEIGAVDHRIYLFYDGYGIYVSRADSDEEPYYFVRV